MDDEYFKLDPNTVCPKVEFTRNLQRVMDLTIEQNKQDANEEQDKLLRTSVHDQFGPTKEQSVTDLTEQNLVSSEALVQSDPTKHHSRLITELSKFDDRDLSLKQAYLCLLQQHCKTNANEEQHKSKLSPDYAHFDLTQDQFKVDLNEENLRPERSKTLIQSDQTGEHFEEDRYKEQVNLKPIPTHGRLDCPEEKPDILPTKEHFKLVPSKESVELDPNKEKNNLERSSVQPNLYLKNRNEEQLNLEPKVYHYDKQLQIDLTEDHSSGELEHLNPIDDRLKVDSNTELLNLEPTLVHENLNSTETRTRKRKQEIENTEEPFRLDCRKELAQLDTIQDNLKLDQNKGRLYLESTRVQANFDLPKEKNSLLNGEYSNVNQTKKDINSPVDERAVLVKLKLKPSDLVHTGAKEGAAANYEAKMPDVWCYVDWPRLKNYMMGKLTGTALDYDVANNGGIINMPEVKDTDAAGKKNDDRIATSNNTPFSGPIESNSITDPDVRKRTYSSNITDSDVRKIAYLSDETVENIKKVKCTDEKSFKCYICNKVYEERKKYMYHLRCHCKDGPFNCEICNLSYKKCYFYNDHMRRHFGNTYKCDKCGRYFAVERRRRKVVHGDSPYEICKEGLSSISKYRTCGVCHFAATHKSCSTQT